jgi:hypothetical protein
MACETYMVTQCVIDIQKINRGMRFRDFSKWKTGVKLCVIPDKVWTVIRKMGYTYMFRVNNTSIISKEKFRC